MNTQVEPRPALIAMGIALVACVIGVIAFGTGKATGAIDPLAARRGVGVLLGLMLMATGNFVPKLRLFQPAVREGQSLAVDRFAGWTFVGCGLGFAAVFLFAPANLLFILSPAIVFAGFLLVGVRWAVENLKQRRFAAPRYTTGRHAMVVVLVMMLWVSATFMADAKWGDEVSRWMVMLLLLAVAVPPAVRAARTRKSPDI